MFFHDARRFRQHVRIGATELAGARPFLGTVDQQSQRSPVTSGHVYGVDALGAD